MRRAILLLFVSLCTACSYSNQSGNVASQATLHDIKPGVTKDAVQQMLGPPATRTAVSGQEETWVYYASSGSGTIVPLWPIPTNETSTGQTIRISLKWTPDLGPVD